MNDASGLRLVAQDPEDLQIIAATVQDAIARPAQWRFEPKARRFIAPVVRFRWERVYGPRGRAPRERVRAALQFDGVLSARTRGLPITDSEAMRPLLTIAFEPDAQGPGGVVRLVFGGGGEVALEIECLDVTLVDVSEPWRTRLRPRHD